MARSAVVKREKVWTAVRQAATALASGIQNNQNVVEIADWSGAVGFTRATLVRIRGEIAVSKTAAATATTFTWCVMKLNVGETVPNINTVNPFTEEDILGYGTGQWSVPNQDMQRWTVDIKAKRRIDNNTVIVLALVCAGDGLVMTYITRGLVLLE